MRKKIEYNYWIKSANEPTSVSCHRVRTHTNACLVSVCVPYSRTIKISKPTVAITIITKQRIRRENVKRSIIWHIQKDYQTQRKHEAFFFCFVGDFQQHKKKHLFHSEVEIDCISIQKIRRKFIWYFTVEIVRIQYYGRLKGKCEFLLRIFFG